MTSLQIQAAAYRLCNCKSICPRHPDLQWEVIKRLAANQLHGNRTPPRIAPSCPHLLRRITEYALFQRSTLWPDRSIFNPIACHRHTGGRPVLIADCLPLHTEQSRPWTSYKVGGVPAVFCPIHHGAVANVAYAHHNSNGNVSDEWVFFCQGTGEATKNPLTLFAVE